MRNPISVAFALALATLGSTMVSVQARQRPKAPAEEPAKEKMDQGSTQSQAAASVLTTEGVAQMAESGVPDLTILKLVRASPCNFDLSPEKVKKLKDNNVSDEVMEAMASCRVYVGWSVLPAKVVRDNYGHYVSRKYFAVDIAVYNRTANQLIVNAFEFHRKVSPGSTQQRDEQRQEAKTKEDRTLSTDPALVRGSLQKGQIAGWRHILVGALQLVAYGGPSAAPFFKNVNRKSNYQTGIALANAILKGFDENIFPDTILTYLRNWDKDEVFKKGFVIAGGESARGRIFLPIELIYPRSDTKYKEAVKGKYDPTAVKLDLNSLSVLGQEVSFLANRTVTAGPQ